MVDQVANNAISTMLRAQSVGTSSAANALKNNKQATQAIMAQLQEGAPKSSSSNALSSSTFASGKISSANLNAAMSGSSDLPRGSLVDMLV